MNARGLRVIVSLAVAVLLLGLLGALALLGSYVYLEPTLPSPESMRNVELQVPLRVYTRGGQLIAQIGEQRRIPVAYEDIPVLVREAFLAAEDDRFFEHHGVDFVGILRAVFVNLITREAAQGASTITQQAARNMFLTLEKTWHRKLAELFVTLRMEHEFSKEQILGLYLNVIFFGQRSYGVAAASEAYFGKRLDELSVGEAAVLAGLPKAPSAFNPVANPRAALGRRHYVLQRMLKLHFIDPNTYARADKEALAAREHAPIFAVEAPYVAEMARAEIVARFGPEAINAGYKVYTSLDGRLQGAANRAVRLGLIEYDRRHGYRGPLRQLQLPPAPAEPVLDAALAPFDERGTLKPAIVVSVAATNARVYVRGAGPAQIDWDGMAWARRRVGNSAGPAPHHAEDVLRRGDVIYVVADGRGNAQLAQVPEAQGALVALDPQDGAVTALVGGFDFFLNKFNRVIQAHRQPGSGFKPFLYSGALENGFTPASIILDAPILSDDTGAEQAWRPENSSGDFGGPTRLREALVRSRNLVSIRIVRQIGVPTAIEYASRFGFPREAMPQNLTLALGTIAVSPIQVAGGYTVFANGGFGVEPYFIDRIDDANDTPVYRAAPKVACAACEPPPPPAPAAADGSAPGVPVAAAPSAPADPNLAPADGGAGLPVLLPPAQRAPRVISAANAWLMDDMMADVIKRGTGRRALVLGRADICGKTGTTNESKNTWFNGFTTRLVASVWVGFDNEQPLGEGEEGSKTAVPIWVYFMREALHAVPDVPRPMPAGLVTLRISPRTGQLAAADDPGAIPEFFLADHLPAGAPGATSPSNPATPGTPAGDGEPLF